MTFTEYDDAIRSLIVEAGWCIAEEAPTWVGSSAQWREWHAAGVPPEVVAQGDCDAAADQHS
jgi:hypothetical protein